MGVLAISAAAVLVLAGCVPSTPSPTPKATGSSATPTPTKTVAPTFSPTGTADVNEAYFDFVNKKLITANGAADGKTIIDNLVAAGFNKAAMQVTPDKTSINGAVDSILFSVKMGDECLLGQRIGTAYSSAVQAALKDGSPNGCLIGKTRPIDW